MASDLKVLHRDTELLHSPAFQFTGEQERINEIPDLFLRGSEEQSSNTLPHEYKFRTIRSPSSSPSMAPPVIPLRSVKDTELPRSIWRIPRAYPIDIAQHKDVLQQNGNLDWFNALYGGRGYYFAPIPNELYGLGVSASESDYTIDLTFDLSAQLLQTAQCTHAALLQHVKSPSTKKWRPLELTIDKERLEAALGKIIDFGRTDYHCLPLCIKVKRVQSNLPIPMNAQLRTRVSPSSPMALRNDYKYINWAQPTHITNAASTGAHEPGFLIPACTTSADQTREQVLYMPNASLINHPCFSRWIAVDFNAVHTALNQMVTDDKRYYSLKTPPPHETLFNFPFWFFVEHFPSIQCLTNKRKAVRQYKEFVNQRILEPSDNNMYIHTPKDIYDELLNRRKTLFDKDRLLMYLDELTLHVNPLHGDAGWNEYANIQTTRFKQGIMTDDTVFARFSVTLSICFEPYLLKRGSSEARLLDNEALYSNAAQPAATAAGIQHRELAAIEQSERRFWSSSSGSMGTPNDALSHVRVPLINGLGGSKKG